MRKKEKNGQVGTKRTCCLLTYNLDAMAVSLVKIIRDVKIFWIIFDTLDCFHNRYYIGRSLFIMNHDILFFYPQEIRQ